MEKFSFAAALEASGISEMDLQGRAQREDQHNQFVLLRQLSEDGNFVRTVRCLPGQITVLFAEGQESLELFRKALLGEKHEGRVILRYGSHDLHHSEVNVATNMPYIWSSKSVADILRAAGISEQFFQDLLNLIGLGSSLNSSPQDLDASSLRRLAILCSFFSRTRLLYYDRPFLNLDSRWTSVLAGLMLQAVEVGRRIVVVTGMKKLPAAWKGNKVVLVEGRKDAAEQEDDLAALISRTRSVDDVRSYIVTRPQFIYPPVGTTPETLQAEAIRNPNLAALVNQEEPLEALAVSNGVSQAAPPEVPKRVPTGMRRTASGRLTRVSGVYKMKRSPLLTKIRKLKQYFTESSRPDNSSKSLYIAIKVAETRKGFQLQQVLFLLITFVLLLMVIKLM